MTLTLIVSISIPLLIALVGLAFAKPERYMIAIANPLNKLTNAIVVVIMTYSISETFILKQLKEIGVTPEQLESLRDILPSTFLSFIFCISAFIIGYLPPLVALYIQKEELAQKLSK